jgi:hypothetical protein
MPADALAKHRRSFPERTEDAVTPDDHLPYPSDASCSVWIKISPQHGV